MKRTEFRVSALLLALLLLVSALFGCQPKATEPIEEAPQEDVSEPAVSVTYELTVRNSQQHTAAQETYLKSKQYNTPTADMNGKAEQSRPEPIVLKWSRKVTGGRLDLKEAAIISEDENFTNPTRIESSNSRVELLHVELGKVLYWYVEGRAGDMVFQSDVSVVHVSSDAPRTLDVGGVTNCRDLGGWKTSDGKTLKQGLLFRTGQLSHITSEGKALLLDHFGIKTEIDLRNEAQVKDNGDTTEASKLGSSVNYVFAPMEWENLGSDNILTAPVNEQSLLKVFAILGDEANYPLLFHCKIGTDRTGLIAFLIEGLCGVSEEDIYRDFLFSGFATINKTPEVGRITGFLNTVKEAPGDTLAEQIENYLLLRGIPAEQIATIRRMMK